jgi:hypothetical protein
MSMFWKHIQLTDKQACPFWTKVFKFKKITTKKSKGQTFQMNEKICKCRCIWQKWEPSNINLKKTLTRTHVHLINLQSPMFPRPSLKKPKKGKRIEVPIGIQAWVRNEILLKFLSLNFQMQLIILKLRHWKHNSNKSAQRGKTLQLKLKMRNKRS